MGQEIASGKNWFNFTITKPTNNCRKHYIDAMMLNYFGHQQ